MATTKITSKDKVKKQPLLTIAIPAYNVQDFIEETVNSLTKSKYVDLLEILIINDGSKDKTKEIGKKLEKECASVKLIDKKNGGHGSGINSGIKHATGKYFRLLDGDDWFDTVEFDKYLEHLKNEDADLVLSDFVECFMKSGLNRPVTFYNSMKAFKKTELKNCVFQKWGPMLPTSTIKTELYRKANFKIDEKCFYVDQEYNLVCYMMAKTVTYYPFMIYQYRLDREGQSMQRESVIRNVYSHEKVCIRLVESFEKYKDELSETQKNYLINRVIVPMCNMQYMITEEWCHSKEAFLSFDTKLKAFPFFYNLPEIAGKITKAYRKTNGVLVPFDKVLRRVVNFKNKQSAESKKKLISGFLILITIVLANLLVVNYLKTEKMLYSWDLSAYWKNANQLLEIEKTSGLRALKSEIVESLSTDYNHLPIVPMLPILKLLGNSRTVFVLTIFNLYIVPFCLILTYTIRLLFKKYSNVHFSKLTTASVFASTIFFPALLVPVFDGRPDAICLVVVALIFLLIAKTKMEFISSFIYLGFLSFVLILLRRYFSFFAIANFVTLFIILTGYNLKKFGKTKLFIKKSLKLAAKFVVSGLTIIGLMFIFSRSLLMRYIGVNYSEAYSAYLLGDFWNQILLFVSYFGLIILGLAIIGVVFTYKKSHKNFLFAFLGMSVIEGIIGFLLFTRVQTLGVQHMYIILPSVLVPISYLVIYLTNGTNSKQLKIVGLLLPVVIILLALNSFTGERQNDVNRAYNMIFGISRNVRPVVRKDFAEINNLYNDLASIMKPEDYVYFLSSSDILNEDMINNFKIPRKADFNISGVHHIDKRDGFPVHFFEANYIVVADPIQTHVERDGQRVITEMAQDILDGKVKNLTKIRTYTIEEGVKLNLYHKTSSYSEEYLKDLKNRFKNYYYSLPFLWEVIPETSK